MKNDCIVKLNCINDWACELCENYERYYPKKTNILSPRQIQNREERKNAKRERRNTTASKRGRANRGTGRRAEKTLETLLLSWGFPCSRVPMSGSLKGSNIVGVSDDILAGDIRVLIKDKYRRIEVKRRSNFKTYYGLVSSTILHIEGFCYMMNRLDFKILLDQGQIGDTTDTPDKRFKTLHDFFDQDNSDIVAMKWNNQDFIYAVNEKTLEELIR